MPIHVPARRKTSVQSVSTTQNVDVSADVGRPLVRPAQPQPAPPAAKLQKTSELRMSSSMCFEATSVGCAALGKTCPRSTSWRCASEHRWSGMVRMVLAAEMTSSDSYALRLGMLCQPSWGPGRAMHAANGLPAPALGNGSHAAWDVTVLSMFHDVSSHVIQQQFINSSFLASNICSCVCATHLL